MHGLERLEGEVAGLSCRIKDLEEINRDQTEQLTIQADRMLEVLNILRELRRVKRKQAVPMWRRVVTLGFAS